tara:strand:+ start:3022 stop:3396 length:375 start_codon:yes stop_codon:yes gene_type:complete
MSNSIRHLLTGWLCAVFMLSGFSAQAGMIGTERAASTQSREASISTVNAFMARDDVRGQLEAWGVESELASQRVASLSDEELQRLSHNIENQPAGSGALAVVGIVFVVLLILELVGVTNIFTRF